MFFGTPDIGKALSIGIILRFAGWKVLQPKNMIRKHSVNQPDIDNMLLKPFF